MRKLFTINGLNEETDIDRRTLKKLLADTEPGEVRGRSNLYSIKQLVIAIRGRGEDSNLEQERTRLTKAQADHEELKVSEFEGELIPAEDVEREWGNMVVAFRARMLALIPRVASQAIAARDLREIEDFTRGEVYAALDELAAYGANEGHQSAGQDGATLDS